MPKGTKKKLTAESEQKLTKKIYEVSFLDNAEHCFKNIADAFADIFGCAVCSLMSWIDSKEMLVLETFYDPLGLTDFDIKKKLITGKLEHKVARSRERYIGKRWISGSEYESIFSSIKNLTLIILPVLSGDRCIGTLSAWFHSSAGLKSALGPMKEVVSAFAPFFKKATSLRQTEIDLKSKRFFDRMLRYSYDNFDYPIDGIERLVTSTTGASSCKIAILGQDNAEPEYFCRRSSLYQCFATKNSQMQVNNLLSPSCAYNICSLPDESDKCDGKLYCCLPINVHGEDLAVMTLEFDDKPALSYWEEVFLKNITNILGGVLRNLSVALDYKELIGNINSNSELDPQAYSPSYIDFVLKRLSLNIASLIRADVIKIWLLTYDEEFFELLFFWSISGVKPEIKEIKSDCLVPGWVLKNKSTYKSETPMQDPLLSGALKQHYNLTSALAKPIFLSGKVIGVIEVFKADTDDLFDINEKTELNINVIVSRMALILERARFKRSNDKNVEKLRQYASELEVKSNELERANVHIQEINKRISMAYEFSRIFSSNVDIGKAIVFTLETLAAMLVKKPSLLIIMIFEDNNNIEFYVNDIQNKIPIKTYKFKLENRYPLDLLASIEREGKKAPLEGTVLSNVLKYLSLATGINHKLSVAYLWPAMASSRKMVAMIGAGFEKPEDLGYDDEQIFLAISYQMAISVRNGRLNRINAIERNKLRALINSISDGVITLDLEMKITACNQAALDIIGVKYDELIGQSYSVVSNVLDNNESEDFINFWLELQRGSKDIYYNDFVIVGVDGVEKYFNASVSPVVFDGNNFGAVVVARDVSEQKLFERMKSDFVAMIAHDLRTPLTAVSNYTSLLLKYGERIDEDKKKEYYGIIHSEIERFNRMLSGLKNVDRIVDMAPRLNPVRFAIKDIIIKIADLHRLSSKLHTIIVDDFSDWDVCADKDSIEAILTNFVNNAVKYSVTGGKITIGAELYGDSFVKIYVKDEGPGISEEDLDKLFTRYSRLDNNQGGKIPGTGLGLYNCKFLAEANDGEVGVKSSPNVGSEFYFTVPLCLEEK